MSWSPRDCHAHTTMSDGALGVAQLVTAVKARGVRPSVSDHISREVALALKSVPDVETYLDALDAHEVGRGGEFCWHDALWRELPDEIVSRFTHWIGSLHALYLPGGGLVSAFAAALPTGLTPWEYMEAHVANLERLAREMPVDILAHPTLVALPLRVLPAEELWSEALEERVVGALYRAGIAFELSSRYRPHERIVRCAVARGLRLSLGSDGHSLAQVGDVAASLALARSLGVADAELYDPLDHGSRVMATRSTPHTV